jgi:copper chaperone CopZ
MKQFKVRGMHCRSCEVLIEEALQSAGAAQAKAHHKKATVAVGGDLDEMTIKKVITAEGYRVE